MTVQVQCAVDLWIIGVCPGSNISAGENPIARSPKGNRLVRKILTQAAQAAVRKKGGHLPAVFRLFVPKLGYKGVTWVVAHRLACLVWKILHNGFRYIEQGSETNPRRRSAAPRS
jgi:hypothetical protein